MVQQCVMVMGMGLVVGDRVRVFREGCGANPTFHAARCCRAYVLRSLRPRATRAIVLNGWPNRGPTSVSRQRADDLRR